MTKSEKRYFKLFAQQQDNGGEFNYLKLFNVIDEQETYNKDEIIASLQEATNIKHFPSNKNYLYHLIIKSLKNYYLSSSKEAEVDELIHCAKILYKKGLYDQSDKILSKSLAMSENHELWASILKITEIQLELSIHVSTSHEEMKKSLNQSLNKAKEALLKLSNLNEYHQLYVSFIELIRKEGELLEIGLDNPTLKKIVSSPFIKKESLALSSKAKKLFYFINGAYHHITADLSMAYEYELKGIHHIETKFDLFQSDYAMLSAQLANLCETCLRMKEYGLFNTYLQKLKAVPVKHQMEESRVFYRYYDLLLRYLVQTGEFKKASDLADVIENGLKQYENNIHKSRELSIKYQLAYAYFGVKNYKKSITWINKLLVDKSDFRSDFISFSHILSCICVFEQGDYLSTESVYRAALYFSNKNKTKSKLETTFLTYFRKIYKMDDPGKRKALFITFKKEMDQLLKSPIEKSLLEYFDLQSWIESKISNKIFYEVVKGKLKKQ